jgi:hypothetical protein
MHRDGVDRRTPVAVFFAVMAVLILLTASSPAAAAGTGSISGTVYKDLNRDGIQQPDDLPLAGQQLYLFSGTGAYLGTTLADDAGRYQFTGLTDADYRVDCEASALEADWVPTTTGSVYPYAYVHLAGSGTVDFGWRPIVRSTDLNSPLSTFVGTNGLRVETFNDALSATDIYDDLMTGSLVGAEASSVTLRFGYGNTNATATSVAQSNGVYSGYHAISTVSYASWLNGGDQALFHEYGHAWSLYYAFMIQQDPNLSAYLKARGLAGDLRVNSSYGWAARELIAEDYRQLFGSANARALAQANQELPPASEAPGLAEFLAAAFTQPPGSPQPPAPPPLAVEALSVTPAPVTTSGTVSFTLSVEAAVTVKILNKRGTVVRTLLSNLTEPGGSVNVAWDRRNAKGRKVAAGTYTARVSAVDSSGASVVATKKFSVA